MHCPACHAENPAEAVSCSVCGGSLGVNSPPSSTASPSHAGRRFGSRKRSLVGEGEATGQGNNPMVRRAYRVSLLSLVPVVGLLLGPLAVVLACLTLRNSLLIDDVARNRIKAAILLGVLVTLTQWIGIILMICNS
jgi:hypothetical protein